MKNQAMDQSRSQFSSGFWLVCKYCQRAFRDKLELFCHQVNEHPEYREELNNGQRATNSSSATGSTHEVIYSDPRSTIESKRSHTNYIQATQQHASASWYPQSTGTLQSHTENQNYYATPVEYYVVVPNQTHPNTAGSHIQQQVMNIPVTNQHFTHATSHSTSHTPQQDVSQIHTVLPIRNDISNDWSKIHAEVSETDITLTSKDDVDYFCWKCKVKFGNATAYISHSGSCFPPAHTSSDQFPDQIQPNSSQSPSQSDGPKKRGKRSQHQSVSSEETSVDATKRRRTTSGHPEQCPPAKTKNRKKQTTTVFVTTTQQNSVDKLASDTIATNSSTTGSKSRRSDEHLSCVHCGVKCASNEKLLVHVQDCKSKKNPYESYQYKCIKCSESFDIYLNYKRHIAIHTGEIRYS